MKTYLRSMAGGLTLISLLIIWQCVVMAGLVSPRFLPAPLVIVERCIEQLGQAAFLFDLWQTLFRLLLGFMISLAIGVLLGIWMAGRGELFIFPLVKLISPIPKIALYPIFMLLLGYGHASKVALVVADVVFPILLATFHGIRSVQPKLLWSAKAMGASRFTIIYNVLLPAALPSILTACRIGLVIACMNVFLAEMISSSDGLGHVLVMAARSYQIVDMFVPLVMISCIGLALNAILQYIRRHFIVFNLSS